MKYLKNYKIFEMHAPNILKVGDLQVGQIYNLDGDEHNTKMLYLGERPIESYYKYLFLIILKKVNTCYVDTYSKNSVFVNQNETIEQYLLKNSDRIIYIVKTLREATSEISNGVGIRCKEMLDRLENNPDIKKYMELDQLGKI